MERGLIAAALALGCGSTVTPNVGESTSGTSTTGTSSVSSSGSSGGSTMSASTSTASDDDESDGGVKLDAGPPEIESCGGPPGASVDLDVQTPTGPFGATHAWWGWELCCVTEPRLVLAEVPELEIADYRITTPHVFVWVDDATPGDGPLQGDLPVEIGTERDGATTVFDSGFRLTGPIDPSGSGEDAQPRLVATIALEGDGWSIHGTVDAPHCPALDTFPCPCE